MNKLDDFLKSKLENATPETPLGWDALDAALPVATSYSIAKWAFAIFLLGGVVATTLFLTQKPSAEYTHQEIVERPAKISSEPLVTNEKEFISVKPEAATKSVQPDITQKRIISSLGSTKPMIPVYVSEQTASNSENGSSVTNANTQVPVLTPNLEEKKEDKTTPEDKQETAVLVDMNSKPNKPTNTQIHQPSRKDFHNGKLYVGASFSPIFSFRSFQLNDGAAPYVNKNYDAIRQNSEATSLSYGASISLEYKFSRNFSLQGGISYNNIGYKTNYDYEINDKAITDNTGRVIRYENLPNSISIKSNNRTKIDVLRIPVGINYNLFLNPDMLFHFYVGGTQNILLSASGIGINQLTLSEEKITSANFVKKANEICFDLGVNIALTSKYGFGIDLYYNKWLTNITKNTRENITPFSPGVNFAISRKLL